MGGEGYIFLNTRNASHKHRNSITEMAHWSLRKYQPYTYNSESLTPEHTCGAKELSCNQFHIWYRNLTLWHIHTYHIPYLKKKKKHDRSRGFLEMGCRCDEVYQILTAVYKPATGLCS